MNHTLTAFLLLIPLVIRAQQPTYQDFEVQQPAEPHGGLKALNQFIAVNIRKPFMAQVANARGLVIVQSVVEPDGHTTDVSLMRSLRPDCDREAMRVFALFNAWKPALKDRKAVRQLVTFPIQFGPNEPVHYQLGTATRFYDADLNVVAASNSSAVIRSDVPTDTLGLPTGDLTLFKRKGDKWRKETTVPFAQEPYKAGGKLLIHRLPNLSAFGPVYHLSPEGTILSNYVQSPDGTIGLRLDRDARGMVIKRTEPTNGRMIETTWYGNGQLKYIRALEVVQQPPAKNLPEQILTYWDSTGVQLINEGNGALPHRYPVNSAANSKTLTTLIKQGAYEKGLKQGRWISTYVDGSYWEEELYDKGELLIGRFIYTGLPDTLTYSLTESPPRFITGIAGLNQFIASNLNPDIARKAGVQGLVLARFVVNPDGKLSDMAIQRGLHPVADEEALRVVKAMNGYWPNRWNPGLRNGHPVRMTYTLPIPFGTNQL